MRTLKTLWRLAMDKGRTRAERRKGDPSPGPKAAAEKFRDQTARLMENEPPTRTLQ